MAGKPDTTPGVESLDLKHLDAPRTDGRVTVQTITCPQCGAGGQATWHEEDRPINRNGRRLRALLELSAGFTARATLRQDSERDIVCQVCGGHVES